jgi:hypothetical protein
MHRAIGNQLQKFFFGNFTYLLLSLVLLFAFRPYQRSADYLGLWEIWLGVVFFGAIFNCNHPKKIKIIAFFLCVPALLFDWISIFEPTLIFVTLSLGFTVLFLTLCTASLLYHEVLRAPPTVASLRPIVCAYFMVGYLFGFLFLIVEYFVPGSFQFITKSETILIELRDISELIYYSFGNLTTLGANNMAAIKITSQTIVIIEAIIGQFYIAILVSRVVSLYSNAHKNKFM